MLFLDPQLIIYNQCNCDVTDCDVTVYPTSHSDVTSVLGVNQAKIGPEFWLGLYLHGINTLMNSAYHERFGGRGDAQAKLYFLTCLIFKFQNRLWQCILMHPVIGDWDTLRRKNSNPPSIYLNFEIKHFDDTYGYSIQCGIFEQEMGIFRNV